MSERERGWIFFLPWALALVFATVFGVVLSAYSPTHGVVAGAACAVLFSLIVWLTQRMYP